MANPGQFQGFRIIPESVEIFGGEAKTVSTTAVGLTSGTYTTATHAIVTVERAGGSNVSIIRWRADGTNPTATVGHQLVEDGTIILNINELTALKMIKDTNSSGDAIVHASYFR